MSRPFSFIQGRDDIATRIGHVIADYAHLEFQLSIIYALVSQLDPVVSFNEFYSQRAANNKCGLILRAAKPIATEGAYALLQRICRRFKNAAARRTEVAHCVFMSPNGQLSRLRVFKTPPDFAPVNDDLFNRVSNQFRNLSMDLKTATVALSPAPARLRQVLRALPRPPGMAPDWDAQVDRRPLTTEEKASRGASFDRLKLFRRSDE